jgi:S-adenosylmethionine hydrolase
MKYKIGDLQIEMTDRHTLPYYQQQHKLYDRFLPHLAKSLTGDVVDVGANVGATMAAMAQANPHLEFFCAEPQEHNFVALQQNKKLVEDKLQTKVRIMKNTIGTVGVSLNAVVEEFDYKPDLIKVDVDGMDYDVLNSYKFDQQPMIYFEADYQTEIQLELFKKLIYDLNVRGYTKYFLFDNFGAFMGAVEHDEINHIDYLFDYIWTLKQKRSTMTIYYMDILAVTPKDALRASRSVNDYLELNP